MNTAEVLATLKKLGKPQTAAIYRRHARHNGPQAWQRATDAALAGRVRPELHATILSAKPYVEGRPVKVVVSGEEDLVGVEELVAVKLNPQMFRQT